MIAIGAQRFAEFHAGAHATDEHFRTAPLEANLPVLLALLGVWHRDLCGCASRKLAFHAFRFIRFLVTAWMR